MSKNKPVNNSLPESESYNDTQREREEKDGFVDIVVDSEY